MLAIIKAEIDKFGATLGGASNMDSALELFKLGHHEFSTKVGGMLGHVHGLMLQDPRLPDVVKDSIGKYVDHFNAARNLERAVIEHGSYQQRVECLHAFLADLSIIMEALHGRSNTLR